MKKMIRIALSMGSLDLIPCRNGYLQIDTGYERDYPTYRRRLKAAGIDLAEIKYLFLTHHHDDHAGFLNALTRDTSLTIIANRRAKDLLLLGKNDKTHGGGWVSPAIRLLAEMKVRLDPNWTLAFPPFVLRKQDILIEDDDCQILKELGINGDILYTPGHCIDHQVLVLHGKNAESCIAFCGDAAASMLLFAGSHYCPVFMTDMEAAYQSWQKMMNAGVQVIYPTHGRPFPVRRLREHQGKITTSQLIRFF